MVETPTWWESKTPSQEDLAIARNEVYDTLHDRPVLNSIIFDPDMKVFFENFLNQDDVQWKDIHEKYRNAHFLYSEHDHHGWCRTDMQWLYDALELLYKNQNERIVLMWRLSPEYLKNKNSPHYKKMLLFLTYPNTEFKHLPFPPSEFLCKNAETWPGDNSILESFEALNHDAEILIKNRQNDKEIKSVLHHSLKGAKIIVYNEMDKEEFEHIREKIKQADADTKFLILVNWGSISTIDRQMFKKLCHHICVLQLPLTHEELSAVNFNDITIDLVWEEGKKRIWRFRHQLQRKNNPYDMNEDEKIERLMKVQKFFPWLETFEKAMDYILHVDLDLPEVMKWQKIEWVYVDVDGTLIEYVGINSGKEWTQQLRKEVVELLKKYEAEWKEIIIWTGWDVELKKKHLRSLWITRPIVSKYDYAGVTAEIVVDDTDQNSFITQSKIYPETYIDTTNL